VNLKVCNSNWNIVYFNQSIFNINTCLEDGIFNSGILNGNPGILNRNSGILNRNSGILNGNPSNIIRALNENNVGDHEHCTPIKPTQRGFIFTMYEYKSDTKGTAMPTLERQFGDPKIKWVKLCNVKK